MTDTNIGFGEQKLDTERFKGSTTGTLADPLEKQDVIAFRIRLSNIVSHSFAIKW